VAIIEVVGLADLEIAWEIGNLLLEARTVGDILR
jgi:hypothetical protein